MRDLLKFANMDQRDTKDTLSVCIIYSTSYCSRKLMILYQVNYSNCHHLCVQKKTRLPYGTLHPNPLLHHSQHMKTNQKRPNSFGLFFSAAFVCLSFHLTTLVFLCRCFDVTRLFMMYWPHTLHNVICQRLHTLCQKVSMQKCSVHNKATLNKDKCIFVSVYILFER